MALQTSAPIMTVGQAAGESSVAASGRVLTFANKGSGSNEEARIVALLHGAKPEVFPFSRASKLKTLRSLTSHILKTRPDLVVMEGTGIAGGLAVMIGRLLGGVPYVVSSGDAVGPFVASHAPLAGPAFALYERLLCRWAAGFIGWTPYLVGRAMSFGCRRAMTAAGWAPFEMTAAQREASRAQVRSRLGIAPGQIVFGIVGSLTWNKRVGYCYGKELVEAARLLKRDDVSVVVVGGGSGLEPMQSLARDLPGGRVHLVGQVPAAEVPVYLSAIDVASLPQSLDGVGLFRYTTKVSEYIAMRLPTVTGAIPMAYDLGEGWMWRLPGETPWSQTYVQAMAKLMNQVTRDQIDDKAAAVPQSLALFDREAQTRAAGEFIADLLREYAARKARG